MSYDYAASFDDLIVYQKSRQLARDIFDITKTFPADEKYSLTDQIRRSSRSVGAQIAEAWGKRRYERHCTSKLTDADGEQFETRHWLGIAVDCGYISESVRYKLLQELESIGRMLNSMMQKSSSFCNPNFGNQVKEDCEKYFCTKVE